MSKNFKNNLRLNLNPGEMAKHSMNAIYSTFYRFPLTILLFLVIAAIFVYRIETPYDQIRDIDEILNRVIAVLLLGVPFTLSISLLFERVGKTFSNIVKVGVWLGDILVIFLYYQFLLPNTDMVPMVRLILLAFALVLCFICIPYFYEKENFEIYVNKIIIRLIISCFFTVVLALGLMAILFAIENLLYSDMNENLYIYTWIFGWFVFAPVYFLYGLPGNRNNYEKEDYNKVLKVLLAYIVLPIISVYTIVLYLYFAKILITRVFPKGIVSYLVVSYAGVGIATVFLVWPLRSINKWVRIFTEIYTKLIFLLLIMMFVSIGIRIGEFGYTENRYFILIIGLWATSAMIFININKGKNNIMLFISLAIVSVISVVGPMSAFDVSQRSQNKRFYKMLSKYDMLDNNIVVNKNLNIIDEDKKEISGIISYFDNNHELSDLKYLPDDFTRGNMKETFGFDEYYEKGGVNLSYFNFRSDEKPIEVTGYNILFRFNKYNDTLTQKIENEEGSLKVIVNEENILSLSKDGEDLYTYDLKEHIKGLYKKYGTSEKRVTIPLQELTIYNGNEKADVKIVFTGIDGSRGVAEDELNANFIQGYMLVKFK
ncbi:hypothetical protein SH2C18_32560 [Clostridium sediminicola]|uniref:DUF4153 domain-containing protein n=1 Tax=Clostridium sediminicola TaxID=3114879 RepID=UPI0031F25590